MVETEQFKNARLGRGLTVLYAGGRAEDNLRWAQGRVGSVGCDVARAKATSRKTKMAFIQQVVLGNPPSLDISDEDFFSIRRAARGTWKILGIEERFGIVFDNFLELGKHVLQYSLEDCSTGLHCNRHENHHRLSTMNRAVSNFLSSCRQYLDQTDADLSRFEHGIDGLREKFNALRNKAYDESPEYQLMETLRNFSQHIAMPIDGDSSSSRTASNGTDKVWIFTYQPIISIRAIADFHKVSSIIPNLEAYTKKDSLDIYPMLRVYLMHLGKIHIDLMGDLHDLAGSMEQKVKDTINRFLQFSGDESPPPGLAACLKWPTNYENTAYLLTDHFEHRQFLRNRHSRFTNFHHRCTTEHSGIDAVLMRTF